MPIRSTRLRVHLALLFVQLVFAGFHVVAKATLAHLDPMALAGLRVLSATPILLVVAWLTDRRLPGPRDLPQLALLGLLGVFANQLMFIQGLQRTTASNAALLMPSIPVFAAGVALAFGLERPRPLRLLGIALSVGGAWVMLAPGAEGLAAHTGDLLVLANCLSYGAFLVALRRVLRRLPVMTVIAWTFLLGGGALALTALPALRATDFAALPSAAWAGLAYIVLLPTVIAYSLNTWAVARSTPTLVATYTTLQPLAATALAAALLGERVGLSQVGGGALILAGLLAVSRP